MTVPADQKFTPEAYGEIVDGLDKIVDYMTREYGKTEADAKVWLEDFIRLHYFPVWRGMK